MELKNVIQLPGWRDGPSNLSDDILTYWTNIVICFFFQKKDEK